MSAEQSSAATTSATVAATASGRCAPRRPGTSAAGVRPERSRTARRPARRAPTTSWGAWSPTIATSCRARRRPPRAAISAASSRCAIRNMSGPGLPATRARVEVAYSRAATNEPLSIVSPRVVYHHGLRCIATRSAPPRTRRKARFRFAKLRSSSPSPMTTAAARVPGSAASAGLMRGWSPNSRSPSRFVRTKTAWPGYVRRTWSTVAERAVTIRSAGIGSPAATNRAARVGRLVDERFVATRNGIPRSSRRASASTAPGRTAPFIVRTPSTSRTRARTPRRAARSGSVVEMVIGGA